ncbi:MAG TPA: hypothetical protein VMS04_07865 [Vicinamibacterales bacterium]|nr:hypothetical protein [Vicinamibacterales bacterium]
MKSRLTPAAVALFVAGGAAIIAAPGQFGRPGEISRAEVWVQNRDTEAIPVTLHDVSVEKPIRVSIWNGEPTSGAPPVPVRVARPLWEYQTVRVSSADASGRLNALGNEGWETTGIVWPVGADTMLLLKRPR